MVDASERIAHQVATGTGVATRDVERLSGMEGQQAAYLSAVGEDFGAVR